MRKAAPLLEREGDPRGFHEEGSFWGWRQGVAPFFCGGWSLRLLLGGQLFQHLDERARAGKGLFGTPVNLTQVLDVVALT